MPVDTHLQNQLNEMGSIESLRGVFGGQDLLTVLKQILTRPMSGKMKVDLSCGTNDARADFEQTNANRSRTGLYQDSIGQDRSSKVGHQ
jgi:hypothetical protein